jgi:hypothetical protein
MGLSKHGMCDAAAPRPEVHPGIAYFRGWNGASAPVWSRDAEAVLRVDTTRFAQPVALALRVATFNADTNPSKTLHIRSDGHAPVAVCIARRGIQTVLVHTPVMAAGAAFGCVTLSLESPQSPVHLGLSQDDRMLGIQIVDIREDVAPVSLPIDLRRPDAGTAVLGGGWDRIEEGTGVWSLTAAPQIVLPAHLDLTDIPALAFDVDTLPRPADHPPLQVEVWSANRRVAVWDFAQASSGTRICPVVPSLTGEAVGITFVMEGQASPAMLGINADPRMLGLLIRNIASAPLPEETR